MGLDISGILEAKPCQLKDLKGKAIAIDGYNSLYQFLSSIRQRDGTPLMDSKMRVTSHLSGAFQRTASLLEVGIKPIYVFDG
ncbi:MAG: flap structure-specific endonuclease, partial [Thermoplasmata archaeon]|nr:flap structure-specific endonuclease [Thermoplasmata archaeon]